MSIGTDRSVSVSLRANVTPYIAAIRAATQATGQLQASLRLAAQASGGLTGTTQTSISASRQAAAASQAQAAASRASTAAIRQQQAALALATAQQNAATAASTRAAASAAATNRTLQSIGTRTAAVGAGMLLAVGVAAVAYARFEKQMSGVKAVTNATSAEMDALSAAAISMGAATAFSASEAARAETELAKAGISVADILGGALAGSLSLAAAGQLELGRAAEISGQAMNIFKLGGEDVGRIADTLANGANKSAADVEQLAQAMAQGGLVAASTGLTLEDTVGTLAAFADNALSGSDAGTSLKTMLQRLTPQSDEAASEMDRLGISAYDAQGNFIGMEALAGNLRDGLSTLDTEQQKASLAIMFGSDAVRGAEILYREGAAGIKGYIDATSEVGTAAQVAATQMDNLSGDLEELKGALETGLIQAGGDSSTALRELVQNLTEVVRWFTDLPGPVRQGITQFLIAAGVIAILGGGLLALTTRALAAKAAFAALAASSPGLAAGLTKAAKAGGALVLIFTALSIAHAAGGANEAILGVGEALEGLTTSADSLKGVNQGIRDLKNANNGAGFEDLQSALESLANPSLYNKLQDFTAEIFSLGNAEGRSARNDLVKQLGSYDQALTTLVTSGNTELAAEQFKGFQETAIAAGFSVEEAAELFPQYGDSLAELAANEELAARSGESMSGQMTAVQESTEAAKTAVDDFVSALDTIFGKAFSVEEAQDALIGKFNDLTGGIKANQEALDAASAAGDANAIAAQGNALALTGNSLSALANREALRTLAEGHGSVIGAMAQSGATSAQLQAKAVSLKESFYKQAEAAGFTRGQVAVYAETLDDIPAAVASTVTAVGLPGAISGIGTLLSKLNEFDGSVYTSTVRTVNTTTGKVSTTTKTGMAEGGLLQFYAGGGLRERHIAQIAPAGTMRVWAEPETGGEAYIPLAASKRGRSIAIAREVADRFGFEMVPRMVRYLADGGLMSPAAAPAPPPSLAGLTLDGTLDLGDGIVGAMRAVVLEEKRADRRAAASRAGGR